MSSHVGRPRADRCYLLRRIRQSQLRHPRRNDGRDDEPHAAEPLLPMQLPHHFGLVVLLFPTEGLSCSIQWDYETLCRGFPECC